MDNVNDSLSRQESKFQQLQHQLRDRWQSSDQFDQDEHDILVVPSVSVDQRELLKVEGFLHYEERLLFSLIRLRNPYTRLIYVTAVPLPPIVIDYYLQLLPGIPFSHARDRLLLFSTYDASLKPLSQKILERPRLMKRIRQALRPGKSYMSCYNSTNLEREISLKLNLPLLAPDPDLLYWGTKSGSRQIFADSGVPHPDGSELVWTVDDLVEATAQLWHRQPQLNKIVIKLNEGFSGEGNAILDLKPLSEVGPGNVSHTQTVAALKEKIVNLRFQASGETWESYSSRIPQLGAIAEAFIDGEKKRSPSVQAYITPHGEVKILSTHDQILGGPDGQIYLGCRFPADPGYRLQLQDLGLRVGQTLAKKGAIERYGVDFVAVDQPDRDTWDLQAIEINLRKGGTTHPFMTLKFMTNGRYDLSTGLFCSQQGQPKHYIATDNLQKDSYKGLMPNDLMDIIAYHQLHFDSSTKTGTVFHLMGTLSEFGKLGLTSIGDSREQAEEIYNQVVRVLDLETKSDKDANVSVSHPSIPIAWNR
ncbi:peptide ligase PGM1-related protein [Moorena producens JHB]|uniref:Peptide ligase PGM1-related protein n=1 Tax=Moorena producens (strain JHB) TaxID=1454205 RepID=A0A1D9FY32_MOOP1|nr:peptide ligase PGM1-related protein [Moorena producens]AOY80243.1 peptide ligase PGM1-related protein [Moorena producens JHB]